MAMIIETDDDGNLLLPRDILGATKPHTRFEVEAEGEAFKLVPVRREMRRTEEEAQEWVRGFRQWMKDLSPRGPILPDEALTRESMYD